MAQKNPLKRFKFTYQTQFNEDHDYFKSLYATSSIMAWSKFNNYISEHNIVLHDASVELLG